MLKQRGNPPHLPVRLREACGSFMLGTSLHRFLLPEDSRAYRSLVLWEPDIGECEGDNAMNPGNRFWWPASRCGSTELWKQVFCFVCFVFKTAFGELAGALKQPAIPLTLLGSGRQPAPEGTFHISMEAATTLFWAHSEVPLVCWDPLTFCRGVRQWT